VIAKKTLVNFYTAYPAAKAALEAFYQEVEGADWQKPGDVIGAYPSADVITGKRFVFNIKGNHFRLIADIESTKKLMFIVWVGTQAHYDKLDVKTVSYVKSN